MRLLNAQVSDKYEDEDLTFDELRKCAARGLNLLQHIADLQKSLNAGLTPNQWRK